MRMSESNWNRFETHNKKTTIRDHQIKEGIQKVWSGNRYHPKFLGIVNVSSFTETKSVRTLTEKNAINDGFDSLIELIMELARLNRKLTPESIVWIYPVRRVKEKDWRENVLKRMLDGGMVKIVGNKLVVTDKFAKIVKKALKKR